LRLAEALFPLKKCRLPAGIRMIEQAFIAAAKDK
jgi:hypothetical protein